jgi:VWFA-related protein
VSPLALVLLLATTAPPQFTADVDAVTVDVVVTDDKGAPVTDLAAADFAVAEDGAAQKVESFEKRVSAPAPAAAPAKAAAGPAPSVSSNVAPPSTTGRAFVIVFDDLHLAMGRSRDAREAVAAFLEKGAGPGDSVTLATTSGSVFWTGRADTGRKALRETLARVDGRRRPRGLTDSMSDWEAMRISENNDEEAMEQVRRRWKNSNPTPPPPDPDRMSAAPPEPPSRPSEIAQVRARATEVYHTARQDQIAALEMVVRALDAFAGSPGRKSVILVSEGLLEDANIPQLKTARDAARRANAALYFLDAQGIVGIAREQTAEAVRYADRRDSSDKFSDVYDAKHTQLESRLASEGSVKLAEDTGGFAVRNTNDLAAGIETIARDSAAYYRLGYTSSNPAHDGKWRKIEVKLARPGLRVRARKGYYAPRAGEAPPAAPIPLRLTAYVLGEGGSGKASALVVADIDTAGLPGPLDMGLLVTGSRKGERWEGTESVPVAADQPSRSLTRAFELPPGEYRAQIAVKDKKAGRLGTVTHTFSVPELAKWRVSSVILTDALEAKTPGEKPTLPKMIARRTFPAGGMVFGKFDVYGAPKVAAGYVVRTREGEVVSSVDPSPINPSPKGGISRLFGFGTQGWEAGEYEVALTVKDLTTGEAANVVEAFILAPASQ